MPSEQHASLVYLGAKWLRKNGFGVVTTELTALGCREQADVIGFRAGTVSAIIEAKASKADFRADLKKPERLTGVGLGLYRFYLAPVDVVGVGDLPPGWGLIHADGRRLIDVVRPTGNLWPGHGQATMGDWAQFQHEPNLIAERSVLYSIARRLAK